MGRSLSDGKQVSDRQFEPKVRHKRLSHWWGDKSGNQSRLRHPVKGKARADWVNGQAFGHGNWGEFFAVTSESLLRDHRAISASIH
jgi:hypothetical protein